MNASNSYSTLISTGNMTFNGSSYIPNESNKILFISRSSEVSAISITQAAKVSGIFYTEKSSSGIFISGSAEVNGLIISSGKVEVNGATKITRISNINHSQM